MSLFDVISKPDVIRGGSRTPTTSKTEVSMKIVNGLKLLTIITKNSISDAGEVLDTPLAIFYLVDF